MMTELPTITVEIRQHFNSNHFRSHKNLSFLLDSGTNRSIITESALANSKLKTKALKRPLCITSAFQNTTKPVIFKELLANLYFPGSDKEIPNQRLLVVNSSLDYDGILGMDVIGDRTIEFGCTPVIVNKLTIEIPESSETIFVNSSVTEEVNNGHVATIVIEADATLQPFSSCYVKCATVWLDKSFKPKTLFLMATEEIANANCGFNEQHDSSRNLLRIFNNSANAVVLAADTVVALGYDSSQYLLSEEDFKLISNYLMTKEEATEDDRRTLEKEAMEWDEKRKILLKSIPLTEEIAKNIENWLIC